MLSFPTMEKERQPRNAKAQLARKTKNSSFHFKGSEMI